MSSHPFPVDSDLTNDDWQQIEDLLDDIGSRSRSGLLAGEFYRQLLDRLVQALGALGGAVWQRGPDDRIRLEYQFHLAQGARASNAEQLAPHRLPVTQVFDSGQPRVAMLAADPSDAESKCTAVLQPFQIGDHTAGILEIVLRREFSPERVRSYVRVLGAMAELAEDFHRHRELRELRAAAGQWRRYDQFAQRVHRSLNVEATAYAIANEARNSSAPTESACWSRADAAYGRRRSAASIPWNGDPSSCAPSSSWPRALPPAESRFGTMTASPIYPTKLPSHLMPTSKKVTRAPSRLCRFASPSTKQAPHRRA